jgi:membrane fusion protein (multidrug efflux system)
MYIDNQSETILFKNVEFKYWPQIGVVFLLLAGYAAYRYFAYYDTRSNDAYVSAHVVNIAAIVTGPVVALHIKENQQVKKGTKLIEIDPLPYVYAVQQAKAKWRIAKLNYENDKLAITKAEQQLQQNKIMLSLSQDHYKRYATLQAKGDLATIDLINLSDKMKEQEAAINVAEQELKIAQTNFDDSAIIAAKAELDNAIYLLDHTTLIAPEDGYITNFNVRVGQYINAGVGLFALVETKQWWVVTRYRETALRLIKPGDKADVTIDMYPGKVFHGHVKSIGWGINRVQTGNVAPSTLMYLEATEDWIRIAQRFPVRIYIDDVSDEYPLRIGSSAETVTYRR